MMYGSSFLKVLLISGLLIGCGGCAHIGSSPKPTADTLVIPDYPSAKDQFAFATLYEGSELTSPELDKRRAQMAKVSQTYQKVITNFPNDPEFVPRSYLQLGDCAGMSEYYPQAISYYRKAQSIAPQNEFVQARALYSTGRVYDSQKNFVQGKAMYKQVMDQYSNSQNGAARAIAKKASAFYYQVKDSTPLKPVDKTN